MGKTLSASPRLPLPVSNHVIGSDQHCHPVLPLKSCLSAFHSAPTETPAQPTSPTILVRACPGPYTRARHYSTCQGISYPGKQWTAPEMFVLVHLRLYNSSVWTQRFLLGVRLPTGPVSSLHLASPTFLHLHFSYELNIQAVGVLLTPLFPKRVAPAVPPTLYEGEHTL